jgi:hypothetical protein
VGTRLEVNSGLSGESVRTRQILRCDDAQADSRVNRASCQALGIASAMVMPLLRQQEVVGVFELLSGQPHAFEERDSLALQRLGEMIQTAVDHSEAANRARREIGEPNAASGETALEFEALSAETSASAPQIQLSSLAGEVESLQTLLAEHGNIGKCEECGFPVSGARKLCLDCETSRGTGRDTASELIHQGLAAPSASLSDAEGPGRNWLESHKYLLGTLLVAAVTAAVALWFR